MEICHPVEIVIVSHCPFMPSAMSERYLDSQFFVNKIVAFWKKKKKINDDIAQYSISSH